MKNLFLLFAFIFLSTFTLSAQDKWDNIAVTEETEIYIDSTHIRKTDGQVHAFIKTVYLTQESKQKYVDKIKKVFKKNADKKILKWNDFNYTITYGLYDCLNKRFKIMDIEDYTSTDKLIIKTKVKEAKAVWLLVGRDTVGDFTLYYICDYDNKHSN